MNGGRPLGSEVGEAISDSAYRSGRWIVPIYLAVALAWIVASDDLLFWAGLRDAWVARLSSLKGIGFVMITGLVLHRALSRVFAKLEVSERQRQASEDRLRRALIESPIPAIAHAEDGTILQMSRSWYEQTGYGPEELRTVADWAERAYGRRKEEVTARIDRLFEIDCRVHEGDFEVRIRDGSTRIWEFYSAPLGRMLDGRRVILSMALDVTERRQAERELRTSEHRFRTLVETAPIGIFIQSRSRFAYLNSSAAQLLGEVDPRSLVGKSVEECFHPDDREKVRRRIAILNDEHRSVAVAEERILRADGTLVECEVMAVPVQLGDEHGGLVFVRDISASQAAERALIESTEQLRILTARLLEIQESERRSLARELHDEVGQALTAVKFDLRAVERELERPSARLEDAVTLVSHTLQQIRGMALDLRPALLDDLGLCAALGWYVERHAERTGIRGNFRAEPSEIPLEPLVATACFRACQEALTNVARHSRASCFEVELKQESGRTFLRIGDDGIGFDPSQALDRASAGGSLGLLGIRERVELAGGSVDFRSTPGSGAEVVIEFSPDGRGTQGRDVI